MHFREQLRKRSYYSICQYFLTMQIRTSLLLCFLPIYTWAFATPEQFDTLKIRKTFEVDSGTFKLAITRIAEWEYKIHISKKINGTWQLQNRHIKNTDFYNGYQILDWNKDGFSDMRISFTNGASAENESYLFLYDSIQKKYRNIEMFWWYCGSYEPEKAISTTSPYYFSMLKMGCAGSLNQSYLFTIENFQIKVIGYMIMDYCDEPFDITIFKQVSPTKKQQIAVIPMDYISRHYVTDQDYVTHYWIKHGLEFFAE